MVGGRYRLDGVLRTESAGRVWKARDEVLRIEVVVKEFLAPSPFWHGTQPADFRREGRASVPASDHPNIVAIQDVVLEDTRPWSVSRYIPGVSLADRVRSEGPLPAAEVTRIAADLLSTLAAVHDAGSVHGDVKPANVLLARGGKVFLLDFGLVYQTQLHGLGAKVGSPGYMSPEQWEAGVVGPAADLFSLGATLYQALEGEPPFKRDGVHQTMFATMNVDFPPLRHTGPIASLISTLLVEDPGLRPTARQALAMLEEGKRAPLRAGTHSRWRAFADGLASIFDLTGAVGGTSRDARSSAWENLEQLLTGKYAQLEHEDSPRRSAQRNPTDGGPTSDC